jgi:hypothetical protein
MNRPAGGFMRGPALERSPVPSFTPSSREPRPRGRLAHLVRQEERALSPRGQARPCMSFWVRPGVGCRLANLRSFDHFAGVVRGTCVWRLSRPCCREPPQGASKAKSTTRPWRRPGRTWQGRKDVGDVAGSVRIAASIGSVSLLFVTVLLLQTQGWPWCEVSLRVVTAGSRPCDETSDSTGFCMMCDSKTNKDRQSGPAPHCAPNLSSANHCADSFLKPRSIWRPRV